jgi:hypothetical protein
VTKVWFKFIGYKFLLNFRGLIYILLRSLEFLETALRLRKKSFSKISIVLIQDHALASSLCARNSSYVLLRGSPSSAATRESLRSLPLRERGRAGSHYVSASAWLLPPFPPVTWVRVRETPGIKTSAEIKWKTALLGHRAWALYEGHFRTEGVFFYLYLILYTCADIYDVTRNLKNFLHFKRI